MIWSQEETLHRKDIEHLQLNRLKNTINKIYSKVPYYQEIMDKKGVGPEDISSLSDLQKLPFTEKDDLRKKLSFWLIYCGQKGYCSSSCVFRNNWKNLL